MKEPLLARWRCVHTILVVCLAVLVGGCATKRLEVPAEFDAGALRERAETQVVDGIRVSVAIPSRDESGAIFGVDLSSRQIQPVWLEIENHSPRRLNFLSTGMDPEYFSPREVSFAFHASLSGESKNRLDRHIEKLAFRDPINPDTSVSGFVYTNEDRETKFVTVDLLSSGWSGHLTFLVPLSDRSLSDERVANLRARITGATPIEVAEEAKLRALLEKLPCCTASKDGVQGEPLNVVLIGDIEAAGPALRRRHFHYTPERSLYAFGRPQDLSGRKDDRWMAAQPHVLRIWLTNIRFRGKPVWIGQISTPLGGRFADSGSDQTPPPIDPDVDAARIDFVQDAIYSQLVSKIGFVKGVGRVERSSPRATPDGSRYYTDGLRAVVFFTDQPVSLAEIGILHWESLADHQGK